MKDPSANAHKVVSHSLIIVNKEQGYVAVRYMNASSAGKVVDWAMWKQKLHQRVGLHTMMLIDAIFN